LGHPSLYQFGLQPGFDILSEPIKNKYKVIEIEQKRVEEGEEEELLLIILRRISKEIAMTSLIENNRKESVLRDTRDVVQVHVHKVIVD